MATPQNASSLATRASSKLRQSPATGDVAVLGVAAVWGSSYAVMQLVNASGLSVANFLLLRFAIAAVPLIAYFLIRSIRITRDHVGYGVFYGVMLFAILYLETFGVSRTSASNAGFLITVSVILVPIYARVFGGTRQRPAIYLLSLLALAGCATLTIGSAGGLAIRSGDAIVLVAALIRGYQIYSFGRAADKKGFDVLAVTMVELVVVAVLSLALSPLVGPMVWEQTSALPASTWLLIAYLAVFGSTFAFGAQLFAARRTSATRVALIMSTEPVFAVLFAVLLRGESLTVLQVVGGVVIVTAAAVGRVLEIRPDKSRSP